MLLNLGDAARAERMTAALGRRGVAIRNRSHLPGMAGWVRISAGTDREVDRLLDELRLLTAPEPEALLFDMDGVLVDVEASYNEAIVQTVMSFLPPGRRVDREAVLAVKQRPDANDDHDATCIALAKLGLKPRREEVERRFQALYLGTRRRPGLCRKERWLLPRRDLAVLAARFPLAVVTGRTRAEARMALRLAGAGAAARRFKAVITIDDVRRRKPAPDPVRAALRRLGVKTAWMVGDGPADLVAASRAGLPAIGVSGGGPGAERKDTLLRRYRPLAVVTAAADLCAVFQERDGLKGEVP